MWNHKKKQTKNTTAAKRPLFPSDSLGKSVGSCARGLRRSLSDVGDSILECGGSTPLCFAQPVIIG
jgi:hypothetical protein